MTVPRIAVLINSIENAVEPIFFKKTGYQSECFFILVGGNSPSLDFIKDNFQPAKIIFFDQLSKSRHILSFEEMLMQTNIAKQLLKNRVDHFMMPHRSSPFIEQWAKKHRLKLITTPWLIQQKLENKRYFDDLLKKYQIDSPNTVAPAQGLTALKPSCAYVLQEVNSYGLFGTNFFPTAQKLNYFLKRKHIDLRHFLIREYQPGLPIGISIFLDKDRNYFYSAFRCQCFLKDKNGFPKNFLGIQWLPTDFFSHFLKAKIVDQLQKLTDLLIQERFSGVANIDLLVSRDRVFVLECNPRLSSATPHIFSSLKLTTFKDPLLFFINSFLGRKNPKTTNRLLPPNHFIGCLLDIDATKQVKIKRIPPLGVYSFQARTIKFLGYSMRDFFSRKNCFFLCHELARPTILAEESTICTLFSNFPLFNQASGELNKQGNKLFEYFKGAFLR